MLQTGMQDRDRNTGRERAREAGHVLDHARIFSQIEKQWNILLVRDWFRWS